jgi:glycosyltransferase involved in cell wall biosynthesis
MSSRPEISVAISTYNMGRFLPAALRSLFRQDLPRKCFEIIVVDDGSNDHTAKVLSRYSRDLRVISHSRQGLVASINAAVRHARGRYFVRLDADDQVASDLLSLACRLLSANRDAACLLSDHWEVRDRTRTRKRVRPSDIYTLIACGTVFPTGLLRQAGGYRPLYWEEYDLYLRLRERGEFIYLPLPLYFYRKHRRSMTANDEERKRGWAELANCWGLPTLRSAGCCRELEDLVAAGAMQ